MWKIKWLALGMTAGVLLDGGVARRVNRAPGVGRGVHNTPHPWRLLLVFLVGLDARLPDRKKLPWDMQGSVCW